MASLNALYITVNGEHRRLTSPDELEQAVREIVRLEILDMQDEGLLPSIFDRDGE